MTLPCDYPGCTNRTGLYEPFPVCKSCMNATCPDHQIPGTLTDADVDAPAVCYCKDCADYVPPYNVEVAIFDTQTDGRRTFLCRHADTILATLHWADPFHPVQIRKAARS